MCHNCKAEAGNEVLSIIDHFSNKYQILVGADTLGKEELLVAIALKFQTLIVVDEERLRMLRAIRSVVTDLPDVFTHDPLLGRIVVLAKKEVNMKRVMQCRMTRPTIGIQPSGWSVKNLSRTKGFQKLPIYVCRSYGYVCNCYGLLTHSS